MSGAKLIAEGLRRARGDRFVLEVERLEVPAATTLALLGPSGSGKSTLLALLALLEPPDQGRILLDGREVTWRDRAARLRVTAVFQRPFLIKGTVAANVAYGLALRGIPRHEHRARVERALERVGLAGLGPRPAGSLSGGEAQRVALARALVLEPDVLLLDEPLASLDPLLKRRLQADFAEILAATGTTVVYVTHDHEEARAVADAIAVMREGRIVACGPADEVMTLPPDAWTAAFLGLEPPARGVVREAASGLITIESGAARVVAAGAIAAGTPVMFAVPPEDVVLARHDARIGAISARNRLAGTVVELQPRGATWRVVVDVGGVTLASTVSRAALSELALSVGSPVIAVFKASAVRVAPLDEDGAGAPGGPA